MKTKRSNLPEDVLNKTFDSLHESGTKGANDTYMNLTKQTDSQMSYLHNKTNRILVEKSEDSKMSGFFSLINSEGKKNPDDDDAVLMDEVPVTGDTGEKKKKKNERYTPLEQRKPKILFFADP